jgi:hypothetical protein
MQNNGIRRSAWLDVQNVMMLDDEFRWSMYRGASETSQATNSLALHLSHPAGFASPARIGSSSHLLHQLLSVFIKDSGYKKKAPEEDSPTKHRKLISRSIVESCDLPE